MKRTLCSILILLLLLPAAALGADAGDELTLPEGSEHKAEYLTDGNVKTYASIGNEPLILTWSADTDSAYVQWYELPASFTVDYLDGFGAVLHSETRSDGQYMQLLSFEGCRGIRLTSRAGLAVSELRSAKEDERLPFEVSSQPCDMLLILSDAGDESLLFGTVLARYCAQYQMDVQVCYLRGINRDRIEETFFALSALNVRRCPVFLQLSEWDSGEYDNVVQRWGKTAALRAVRDLLTIYQPRLVLTLDPSENNENGAGRLTGELVIEAALSHENAPEKLYTLSADGGLIFEATDAELELARSAYLLHYSQRVFRFVPERTLRLNAVIELLGADGNDILSGILPETLNSYFTPTAEPTTVPTQAPTDAPTQAPTPANTPLPGQETAPPPSAEPDALEDGREGLSELLLALVGLTVAALVAGLIIVWRRRR
ncbi:MAG: hypothetical protein Q4C04_02365 [Clostridia bacterium]|nr:hypothetical protein [Clostridia bacterium]